MFCRLSFAVICSLLILLAGCGERVQSDPRAEAPLVRTAIAQVAGAESRSFTGTVAARVESDLGFRVSGQVLERLVDAGQAVARGQSLMRIDPVDLELAARAQQEAVSAARASATQAADEERRNRDLLGTGAISVSAYDQIKATADATAARLRAVEAEAQVARNATRYAVLLADADGVVMETLAEPGQVVGAGQTVVRLARAGAREAVVQLPETLRPAVGTVGDATLFGRENTSAPTKLRQLSDAADRLTRTFEARFMLTGELATAPLGSTVTIRIPNGISVGQEGLQVPIGSLFDAGKGPGVWAIDNNSTTVSWRPVDVLRLGDDTALVTGQLKHGDRIVALGAHLLREGVQVRLADQSAVATAGNTRQ